MISIGLLDHRVCRQYLQVDEEQCHSYRRMGIFGLFFFTFFCCMAIGTGRKIAHGLPQTRKEKEGHDA